MTTPTGAQFGPYKITAPLGKGGMGEVCLAEDTRLQRQVALKLLPSEFTQDAERLRRFALEAKTASGLNHPNILTIYDIGAAQDTHFIATEYIAGETLRERLQRPVSLDETLSITLQIAQALAAAHDAGIIHRDIKPENVMLRQDGIVKVLDFGLAKLTEMRNADFGMRNEEAETLLQGEPNNPQSPIRNPQSSNPHSTAPGMVMGTASYMSPEQARGEKVDARTDIFSLGVVLYEMLAGKRPFEGVNMLDIIGAVLHQEPAPLADAPAELQRIVTKALQKDRAARYPSAQELARDLQELKDERAYQARAARTSGEQPTLLQAPTTTQPAAEQASRVPSSDGLAFSANQPPKVGTLDTRRPRLRFALIALTVFALAAVTAFFYFKRQPALTDKDTILLADFENKTGDAVFDGTLRQGLAVQLQQSPFLSLFPDERIRATLRLMNRSADERVTREVGREIALRQGVKAVLAGTIVNLGRNYSLTIEAVNSQSGEAIALVQTEAEGKEQVLKALSQAATQMREKLGESLASIQKFDAPLEVTTSSLEALQAFSQAWEQRLKGDWLRAIPLLQRAVDLDSNFAAAYAGLASMYGNTSQMGLAIEAASKAYALKDRVSEHERLMLTRDYTDYVTGEIPKSIETDERLIQLFPRDHQYHNHLAAEYRLLGQFEKVREAARLAVQLNPNAAAPRINVGWAEVSLNQFAEAKATFEKSLELKLDSIDLRECLYRIAFATGDTVGMQQQLDWAAGIPAEHFACGWQTHSATFAGQWRKAQEFSKRAVSLALKEDAKGNAATYAMDRAMLAAVIGQPAVVKAAAQECLTMDRSNWTLPRIAFALALSRLPVQSLLDEINKQYPKDTIINSVWLPTINTAMELQRGNAQAAITQLENARRYEPAAEFWPQYVRGLAYLKLNQAPAAAAEFQKIIDHRGEAPLSVLWPLAHLGLARATMLQGDTAKAKQRYDEFFKLWKDADADLPVLMEAKKEYEKVK
jgi:serine/threonine protein kinase/Tfp pilus assembly protein PilF